MFMLKRIEKWAVQPLPLANWLARFLPVAAKPAALMPAAARSTGRGASVMEGDKK